MNAFRPYLDLDTLVAPVYAQLENTKYSEEKVDKGAEIQRGTDGLAVFGVRGRSHKGGPVVREPIAEYSENKDARKGHNSATGRWSKR